MILNILLSTGYDNAISLSDLTEQDIRDIEAHVTANPDIIADSYQYNTETPFVFLPGHQKTLFSLRDKAVEFLNLKK